MIIKPIPNYPDYLITDHGDVFSNKFDKIRKLKPSNDGKGYYSVVLCTNGKTKKFKVHTLVLMTYDRMPKEGEMCRHFPDDTKSNNHISNLQWGTAKENCYDRDKVHKTGNRPRNEDSGKCKFSNKIISDIRDLYKTGEYTQRVLADKYNVSQPHICDIINSKTRAVK